MMADINNTILPSFVPPWLHFSSVGTILRLLNMNAAAVQEDHELPTNVYNERVTEP